MRTCQNMAMSLAVDSNQRKFSSIWIQSLVIHAIFVCLFISLPFIMQNKETIHLARGGSVTLIVNPFTRISGLGKNSLQQDLSSDTVIGTSSLSEIENFQNSLSYPVLALEQQLEDDCSYKVRVGQSGEVASLAVLIPCKFNVFDHQIRNQLRVWKFKSSLGKDLVLPIRFRIHASE